MFFMRFLIAMGLALPLYGHAADAAAKTPEQCAEALSDQHNPDLHKAQEALQEMGVKALPAVRALLKHADPKTRELALEVIQTIAEDTKEWQGQDAPLATDLGERLRLEPVDHLRQEIAIALEKMKAPGAPGIPALIETLGDPEKDVNDQAKDALVAIGAASVPALLEQLPPKPGRKNFTRQLAAEALGDIEPQSFETLKVMLPLLNDLDMNVREEAAKSLPKKLSDTPGGYDWLLSQLKENGALSAPAAYALGAGQAPEAKPALTEALQSPRADVRVQAALAVLRLTNPADAAVLDPNPEVKRARTVILDALDDAKVDTRFQAVDALELAARADHPNLKTLAFTSVELQWLLGDASLAVKEAAQGALQSIDRRVSRLKLEARAEFTKRPANWVPPPPPERQGKGNRNRGQGGGNQGGQGGPVPQPVKPVAPGQGEF